MHVPWAWSAIHCSAASRKDEILTFNKKNLEINSLTVNWETVCALLDQYSGAIDHRPDKLLAFDDFERH